MFTEITMVRLAIIGVCLLLFGLLMRRNFAAARKFDTSLAKPVRRLPASWQPYAKVASAILRPRHLGPALIGVGIAQWGQNNPAATLFCGLIVLGMAAAELLKSVIKRPRPANDSVNLHRIKTLSFPSGHATSALLAALAAVSLASPAPVLLVLIVLVGLGIGASRAYLQVHYPSDIVGGWLLAVMWWQASLMLSSV